MSFSSCLQTYAELIVKHGLNVQKGQVVNINTELVNRDTALAIVEEAYRSGAKLVNVDFVDARVGRTRILHSGEDDLTYVPRYISTKYEDMVTDCSANLRLIGSENPDVLADLDPRRVNLVRKGAYQAMKTFYQEGIGKSKVHWTVAAAATPGWARKIFPERPEQEALSLLWENIFRVCRADTPNCLQQWKEHNDSLHERGQKLTKLKISQLHFTGPGTDLKVGLSPRAIFKGGGDRSPRNVEFEPNIPTEEVFTTPDWRATEGTVRATRPFLINGVMIRDWSAEFKAGQLVSFDASSGRETYQEYIDSDEGGRRLGEVALVGIDSPVFTSGLVFQEILFDENAACHIAIGSAYKFCLEGGDTMSKEELEEVGCNESSVHTDMMISDESVDVTATTVNGDTTTLLVKGQWVF